MRMVPTFRHDQEVLDCSIQVVARIRYAPQEIVRPRHAEWMVIRLRRSQQTTGRHEDLIELTVLLIDEAQGEQQAVHRRPQTWVRFHNLLDHTDGFVTLAREVLMHRSVE